MAARARGPWLTTAAVLLGVLAISNALKPFAIGGDRTGFVFLGERLHGTWNMILGPTFAVFLAAYAVGVWGLRRFALPMAWIYAGYVLVNLLLFRYRTPQPPDPSGAEAVFGIVYAIVALGFTFGTARTLSKRAAELS
jgi:hypothetical protein